MYILYFTCLLCVDCIVESVPDDTTVTSHNPQVSGKISQVCCYVLQLELCGLIRSDEG